MRALYANEPEVMKEHTDVMIALPVPERYRPLIAALQTQVSRGTELVPAEELHVTLLYLGDSSEVEHLKTQIYAGSLNAIEWQDGIRAKLTGLARFNGNEGGRNPLVLLVDSPLLPGFRQRIAGHLVQRGIPDSQRHGFIPHITLGYISVDAKTPQIEIPQEQIVFDSLVVAWGDEQLVVPLSGEPAYKADGKGYGARAGETIRGNLTRGGDGKFASGGDSPPAAEEAEIKPTVRRQRLGRTAAAAEERKRQAREAKRAAADTKKRATAAEREKKRQERAKLVANRRREREMLREDAKRKKQQEAARLLQENREKTLERTPLNKEAYDALLAFSEARDGDFDPRMIEALGKETGLIAFGADGSFRMTPEARAFLKALDKGDARAARDAISKAGDRLDREESREEKRRAREESQKSAGLSVFKDASGRYRWVLLSSNAYRDRDGEIVSTKALAQDVARADTDKDYGPLRWWHVPGCDIGDCDYNAMSGRVLVESGTFRSEAIGHAVYKAQANLQSSIGFRHPSNEPDTERVYHNIRRFERSLVPTGRAANRFTKLVVKQRGDSDMDNEKMQALVALIGEEAATALLSQVMATQKEADATGTTYKAAVVEAEAPVPAIDVAYKATAGSTLTLNAADVARLITAPAAPVTSLKEEGEMEEAEEETEEEAAAFAGDLEPKELVDMIVAGITAAIAPLLEGTLKSMAGEAHKSDDIALLQEQQARKALEDTKTAAALKAQQEELAIKLKEVDAKLAELIGEQPRALQQGGYRASQAADTVPAGNYRLKESQPAGLDPNFFTEFLGGKNGQLPPV